MPKLSVDVDAGMALCQRAIRSRHAACQVQLDPLSKLTIGVAHLSERL